MSEDPPPPSLPIPAIILMCFSWISVIVYLNLVYILISKRRKISIINSPFFKLMIYNSIVDILMFLNIEFIMRPRKYRYFGLFGSQTPQWYAHFSFFILMLLKTSMDIGYIPPALNRLTATVLPMVHDKLWNDRNVLLIVVSTWSLSLLVDIIVFLLSPSGCYFLVLPNGILQMLGKEMNLIDTLRAAISTTISFLFCLFSYTFTILATQKSQAISQSTQTLEGKLLLCALCSTVPMVGECARALYMAYGSYIEDVQIIVLTAEIWFYWTEIMTSAQCWSLLLITPNVRQLLIRNGILSVVNRNDSVSISQVSALNGKTTSERRNVSRIQ